MDHRLWLFELNKIFSPRVTSLRPNTALGVSFEKEQKKKVPPLQRKFQTRHTFDGVTINILYNGPKGDNNGKKRTNGNGDKYSPRPRSSQASRTSQGSSQGKRRDSVSRSRSSKVKIACFLHKVFLTFDYNFDEKFATIIFIS